MNKIQGMLAAATFLALSGGIVKSAEIANANLGEFKAIKANLSASPVKPGSNFTAPLSRVPLQTSEKNNRLSKGANKNFTEATLGILAEGYGNSQSSPWGQVAEPQTYTNPETGQTFCFYTSGRWAPCPGQGTTAIIPENAQCRGGGYDLTPCPRSGCELQRIRASLNNLPSLPCEGLP